VKPYPYEYVANAKGRWIGRTLIDIYAKEFRDATVEYYVSPPLDTVALPPRMRDMTWCLSFVTD